MKQKGHALESVHARRNELILALAEIFGRVTERRGCEVEGVVAEAVGQKIFADRGRQAIIAELVGQQVPVVVGCPCSNLHRAEKGW